MQKGIIVKNISNLYKVETENNIFLCEARGKFKKSGITPAVGDRVQINSIDEQKGIIEEVLETIIKVDTPYKGVPCTFARPPVMTRGSIQFFYITNFLRNPDINVIKISPLVLVMPNAD